MKNFKIIRIILTTLLLIPFRLPISVLLIKGFTYIATLGGTGIPTEILGSNVIVTKLVYDLVLVILLVISVEKLSIQVMGRKALHMGRDETIYWWTVVLGFLLAIYTAFDMYWTYELFNCMYP